MGLDKPTTGQAFLVGPSKPRPVDHWSFDSKFAIEDDEKDSDYEDDQEKSDASPALEKTGKIHDTLELVDDVEYRREQHQARVHDL